MPMQLIFDLSEILFLHVKLIKLWSIKLINLKQHENPFCCVCTTATLRKWQGDCYIWGDRYIQVNFAENIRQLKTLGSCSVTVLYRVTKHHRQGRYIQVWLCMLLVKIKFRLKTFNLGWFSISLYPSPNYSFTRAKDKENWKST